MVRNTNLLLDFQDGISIQLILLYWKFPLLTGPHIGEAYPFLDYLDAQMKTRKATAWQPWREIVERDIGSYGQVSKWVTGLNKQQGHKMGEFPTGRLPRQDICSRLLTRQLETLTNDDAYSLGVLLEIPILQQLYTLVRDFATMIRQHNVQPFDSWLRYCETSSIQACQLFAQSLIQDFEAFVLLSRLTGVMGRLRVKFIV